MTSPTVERVKAATGRFAASVCVTILLTGSANADVGHAWPNGGVSSSGPDMPPCGRNAQPGDLDYCRPLNAPDSQIDWNCHEKGNPECNPPWHRGHMAKFWNLAQHEMEKTDYPRRWGLSYMGTFNNPEDCRIEAKHQEDGARAAVDLGVEQFYCVPVWKWVP